MQEGDAQLIQRAL